jgi:replicative DNA helicase
MASGPSSQRRPGGPGGGTNGAAGSPVAGGIAPPHNLEAEQSVLGAILLSDRTMYTLVIDEGLGPGDFYRDRHRLIYAAMLSLYHESEPVDYLTVTDRLRQTGQLEEAGGQAAVEELTGVVPSVANARRYAQIVRENALLRRLLMATYEIQAGVIGHDAPPRELVELAEKTMLEVARDDRQKDFRPIDEVLHTELEKLEKLSREGTSLTGTPSGFTDLDEITGGFQPGNLVIIAARPAMGKCLVGSTLIPDPTTGARARLADLVARGEAGHDVWVSALNEEMRLVPARASAFIRSGHREVFRVHTRHGRTAVMTASHPLLTVEGWTPLEQLAAGDRIAVPRRAPATAELRSLRGQAAVSVGNAGSTVLSCRHLHAPDFARSDVRWDEISGVEAAGVAETFDLTVPVHHNFVADDLIVHNSALVTNIAENAAIEFGKPVALFSLEMSEAELAQRFVASQARIRGEELRKGRVPDSRWPKILTASQRLAASPLFVDDSSDLGMLEVRAKARRLHSNHPEGLGLIIIDYLQLMRTDSRIESRVTAVGELSRGLKVLARELGVPVIALSQLSRAVESRTPKTPQLSDLRESGNLEQDADLVMFIYRDEYYDADSERPGEADLIIAKHRNGAVGTVTLTFQKEYPKFMNYAGERYAG